MPERRVSWASYYLGIADAVAVRADCTRRKVGAVVVNNGAVIATGYNGSPPGEPGCLSDNACPRGRHYQNLNFRPFGGGSACACGNTWPCADAVPPGSSYTTGPGSCISSHAEINACVRAGERGRGGTIYITDEPCGGCIKVLKSTGLVQAIWYGGSMDLCPPKMNITRSQKLRAKLAKLFS